MSEQLTLTLTPERAATLKGIDTQVNILLQIKAPPQPKDAQRAPLNLSVVLDRSGSMSGAPLEVAKQCARFVQSRLTQRDIISLVTYDDQVTVNSPSSAAQPNDHYVRAVNQVEVAGTTNLFGGWEAGVGEVKKRAERYDINRVLLLSDGRLNHGVTDEPTIRAACLEAASGGIKTSTYGLGQRFDESIMCMMAEVSGGNSRYGERVEDLLEGFIEELDLLASLYSSELSLKLVPAEGVKVSCLNSFIKRGDVLILPDLAYDAEVWAGLKLTVSKEASARAADSGEPLLQVIVGSRHLSDTLETQASLGPMPPLSPSIFESVAPAEVVTKYIAELNISELKLKAAAAGQRRDWDLAKALIAEMRALPMTDAQRAEIDELEGLLQRREAEVFSKEARFSGSQSQRMMKMSAQSYVASDQWVGSINFDAMNAPSYLRRKSRAGRASDSQMLSQQQSSPPDSDLNQVSPLPK